MANQSTTADLVIRAKDIQVKPLEDLLRVLKDLETAQKHLGTSGHQAELSMRELNTEAKKFETVAAEISSRRAAVEHFQALSEKSKVLTTNLIAARQAQADFEKTIPAKGRSQDQKDGLAALRAESRSLKSQFDRNAASMEAAARKLSSLGVDTENLATAQRHLADAQSRAQAGADEAVRRSQNHAQVLRDEKKATEELAAARLKAKNQEQAAHDLLANREMQGRKAWAAQGAASGYGDIADAKAIDAALARRKREEKELAAQLLKVKEEGSKAAQAIKEVDKAAAHLSADVPAVKSLSHEIATVLADADKAKFAIDRMGAAAAGVLERQARVTAGKGTKADRENLGGDRGFLLGAQKETMNQVKVIEAAKQTAAEVQRLSTALAESKAKLDAHSRAASTATTVDKNLSAAIADESAKMRSLLAELARAKTAHDKNGQAAAALGINYNKLAEAEDHVRRNAALLKTAVDNLSNGHSVLSRHTRAAEQETSKWGESQRTSLTLMQRLRSEVLQLTLSYIGIHGAMAGVKSVLLVDTQMKKFNQQMSVANGGDRSDTKRDMEFVRWEADRLGMSFKEVADGYGKFNISARFANFSMRETHDIFQGFGQAFKVFGMESEQVKLSLLAIEQMMSKGRVTAEEFRRQLANHLPGLEGLAAKSMNMTTAEFNKTMTRGEISIRNLMLWAQEYQRSVAPQLEAASKTWQSEMGRADTAFFTFKQNIAENKDFQKALADMGKAMQAAFGGNEAKSLADNIAEFLARIVHEISDGIPALVKLMNDLTSAMNAAGGGIDNVNSVILGIGEAIRKVSPDTQEYTQGANNLTKSMEAIVATIENAIKWWVEYKILMMTVPAVLTAIELGFGGIIASLTVAGSAGGAIGATKLMTTAVRELTATTIVGAIAAVGIGFYELGTMAYNASAHVRTLAAEVVGLAMAKSEAERDDYMAALGGADGAAAMRRLQEKEKNSPEARRRRREAARTAAENGVKNPDNAKAALRAVDNAGRVNESYTPVGDYKPEKDTATAEAKAAAKAEKDRIAQGKRDAKRAETEAVREAKQYADNLEATKSGIKKMGGAVIKKGGVETDDDVIARAHSEVNEKYTELAKKLGDVHGPDFEVLKAEMDRAVKSLQQDAAIEALLAHRKDQVSAMEALRDAEVERVKAQEGGAISAQRENAILEKYNTHILELIPDIQLFARSRGKLAEAAQAEAKYTKMAMEINNNNGANKAKLADYREQLQLMIEQRDAELALAEAKQATYADEEEKNKTLEAIRQKYNANILDGIAAVQKLAKSMNDKGQYADLLRDMDLLIAKNQTLTEEQKKQIAKHDENVAKFAEMGTTAYTELAKVALGQEKLAQGWLNIREAFKGMLADYLHGLAQIIIKKQALAAYDALFGKQDAAETGPQDQGWVGTAIGFAKQYFATVKHDGGVVGESGASRPVSMSLFSQARKFHTGGLPGLSHDEIPAILKKREEVLSENDPRNILNGGGQTPAGGSGGSAVTIHNLIDSGDMLASGVATPAGQKAVMNFITANRSTIKKLVS